MKTRSSTTRPFLPSIQMRSRSSTSSRASRRAVRSFERPEAKHGVSQQTRTASSSTSALERISVAQVLRIEVIRGSSPDIKTSSQESLLNIVMRKDDNSGSGTWRLDSEAVEGMNPALGGFLSYGKSSGSFQFELWARRLEQRRLFVVDELLYDSADALSQSKTLAAALASSRARSRQFALMLLTLKSTL